jgi:DNA-binding IclR family transcriptional regulator
VLLDLPGAQVRGAVSQMSRAGLIRRDEAGKWLLTLRGSGGAKA